MKCGESMLRVYITTPGSKPDWSLPIKPEEEHIFAVPGLGGYSLLLIQKQDEEQYRLRRRIMIVVDESDITFTYKMILEENGFNKQGRKENLLVLANDIDQGLQLSQIGEAKLRFLDISSNWTGT
jgi:hypothetical protein